MARRLCNRIYLMPMTECAISRFPGWRSLASGLMCWQDENYGKLVINALKCSGILCLGLYRRMYPDESYSNPNRYVITNPSAALPLLPSDQVALYLPTAYPATFSVEGEGKGGEAWRAETPGLGPGRLPYINARLMRSLFRLSVCNVHNLCPDCEYFMESIYRSTSSWSARDLCLLLKTSRRYSELFRTFLKITCLNRNTHPYLLTPSEWWMVLMWFACWNDCKKLLSTFGFKLVLVIAKLLVLRI